MEGRMLAHSYFLTLFAAFFLIAPPIGFSKAGLFSKRQRHSGSGSKEGEIYSRDRFSQWQEIIRSTSTSSPSSSSSSVAYYKARDTQRHEEVVTIKQIKDKKLGKVELDIYQAVQLLPQAASTILPHYYGTFTDENGVYIVMEHVGGGEALDRFIAEHSPLQKEHVAILMYTLGQAMHSLHELGVAHNNLKASNITILKELDPFVRLNNLDSASKFKPRSSTAKAIWRDVCGLGSLLEQMLIGVPRSTNWLEVPIERIKSLRTLDREMNKEIRALLIRIGEVCKAEGKSKGAVSVEEILGTQFLQLGEQLACLGVDWLEVGRGDHGVIYRVRDSKRDGQVVALKQTGAQRVAEVKFPRLLAEKGFTRVPRYYDSFTSGMWLYVEMEYVEGITLKQYLKEHKNSPQPRKQVASIMYQLSYATSEFHKMGFSHDDLKAENILLAEESSRDGLNRLVRVLDFGEAREITAGMGYGQTIAWDVCALGSLLEQLLSGVSRDWWREIPSECIDKVATGDASKDDAVRALLSRIQTVCEEVLINKEESTEHVSMQEILDNPFVKAGKEWAEDWPFYDANPSSSEE